MSAAFDLPPIPSAGLVIYVGPRRPESRRLVRLGLVSLGLTIAAVSTSPFWSEAVRSRTSSVAAAVESQVVRARVGRFTAAPGSFDDLMAAENAWEMGNTAAASRLWMAAGSRPESAQDLPLAGWALRAAIKSDRPELIKAAVSHWNQVRQALPTNLQRKVPRLSGPTKGPALYRQLVQTGAADAKTYALWLDRRSTEAEIEANTSLCELEAGCMPDLARSWAQLDQQAAAMVQGWKNRGFTAQMAWDLYRERQLLGDADHEISSRHHQVLAGTEQLRLQMQLHLVKVHTPAQLPAYWASWKTEAARFGVDLAHQSSAAVLGGLWSEQVDWKARLRGQSSGWAACEDKDEPTRWARLESAVSRQLATLPVGEVPAHVSSAEADKRLLQAVQESGLRQLRWPAVFPNTPDVKWRLANLVEKANRSLQQATQWSGPVLGHAGRTVLALTAEPAGDEEGFQTSIPSTASTEDNVIISTVMNSDSLGALPHEWMHAHDYFLGVATGVDPRLRWASSQASDDLNMPLTSLWMTATAGAHNAEERATRDLWQALRSPDLTAAQRLDAVLESWVGQQTQDRPEQRALWLADASDVREHRWTVERSQARWAGHRPVKDHQELFRLIEQATQSPAFQSSQNDVTSSPWMQVSLKADRLQADAARPGSRANQSYWSMPTEMIARSFERQLTQIGVVSARDQSVWVYYPQGFEKAWQNDAWGRYFQAQASWWQAWQDEALKSAPGRTLGQAAKPMGLTKPTAAHMGGVGGRGSAPAPR